VVLVFVIAAIFAPWISPYPPTDQSVLDVRQPPSVAHWFGTDQFGRDVFSRVVHGARSILALTGLGALIAVAAGTTFGLVSGYLGGWFDEILMRVFDSLLAIPALLLALVLLGAVGPSQSSVLAVLAVVYTPIVARVVRSETLAIKTQGFVEAARLHGERLPRILFREILPSVLPALSVEAAVRFSYGIFLVASLGFLGVGVRPPTPDWGLMVKEARIYVRLAPWSLAFPAAAISLLVIGVNLAADGLKRALQIGPERLSWRMRRRVLGERRRRAPSPGGESTGESSTSILTLDAVTVSYLERGRWLDAVRDLSLDVRPGETVGLVGESGSGKSTLALAIMRYLAANGTVRAGRIAFEGHDLLALSDRALERLRGARMALIPQDPLASLNPSIRVGEQIAELIRHHDAASRPDAAARAIDMLCRVRIADVERIGRRYPHQLSGGMQQRVSIAMGLVMSPCLLILDEPTTGLDVTTEATILDLLAELIATGDRGSLYITHDLGVVSRVADRVAVLYAGELVELGPTSAVFAEPLHPYALGLVRSIPRIGAGAARLPSMPGTIPPLAELPGGCVFRPRCPAAVDRCLDRPALSGLGPRVVRCHRATEMRDLRPLLFSEEAAELREPMTSAESVAPALEVRDLHVGFPVARSLGDVARRRPRRAVRAVDGVDLTVAAGRTTGLVGESGSGKTTLARAVLGLERLNSGAASLVGERLPTTLRRRSRRTLARIQAVAQNPDQALNPYATIGESLSRPLVRLGGMQRREARRTAIELLERVGLSAAYADRVPAQLSGGEKQRVAIARAFAAGPDLVICDEATSSLDVSVQARVLNLLDDLQTDRGGAGLFITHDLAVVTHLADRIAVMYLGRLMQESATGAVLSPPYHPYTEALLAAHPAFGRRDAAAVRLEGEIPSAIDVPSGCPFHTRCPRVLGEICRDEPPPWRAVDDGGMLCHIPPEELLEVQTELFDAEDRIDAREGGGP